MTFVSSMESARLSRASGPRWVTSSAPSCAWMSSITRAFRGAPAPVPTAAEKRFLDIRFWNEPERGGHSAAFERPKLFVDEVRAFFRLVRVISVRSSGWDQPRSGLAGEPSP